MERDLVEAMAAYDFVRFTFADIHGIARCKAVCKSSFRKFFKTGTGMFVGSIGFGFKGDIGPCSAINSTQQAASYEENGNVIARPLAGTLHPVPYAGYGKYRVGEILCETFHGATGKRQEELPRYIARRQIDHLASLGYEIKSSFEVEFLLVNPDTLEPVFRNPGTLFSHLTLNQFDPVLLEAASQLEAMGVELETLQSECAPGQFEFVLKPQIGLKIADNAFLVRDCVKEVAKKHGLKAVFMTKMDDAEMSNGMHFNHSLRKIKQQDNVSAFSDVTGVDKLSALCRWWLGGLIRHYRALNAICSPTCNCYRRVNTCWTTKESNWGIDNRKTSFRVKNETPEVTYIESRLAGTSCNPYLVFAGMVAAGIDGITHELPCPPPVSVSTPVDGVYSVMEPSTVPLTLTESLKALQDDNYITKALGDDFVKWFVLLKESEIKTLTGCDVSKNDTAMYAQERDLYMNLI